MAKMCTRGLQDISVSEFLFSKRSEEFNAMFDSVYNFFINGTLYSSFADGLVDNDFALLMIEIESASEYLRDKCLALVKADASIMEDGLINTFISVLVFEYGNLFGIKC